MLKREPRDWRRCNIAQRLTRLQGSSVRSLAGLPPTLPFPHPARGVFRLCFRAVQVHDLAFFFLLLLLLHTLQDLKWHYTIMPKYPYICLPIFLSPCVQPERTVFLGTVFIAFLFSEFLQFIARCSSGCCGVPLLT